MKKKGIKLIVLLVILAVCVAGYIVLTQVPFSTEEIDLGSDDTSVNVLTVDPATIVSIDYEYDGEAISMKKVDGKWQWSLDADFPLDQSYPEYMLEALSNMVADRLVAENLENEADFGMDEPNFTVNYSTSDGSKYVYTIGSYNSTAECYYFKSSVADKIYMTKDSAVEPFIYYMLEMIEAESLPDVKAERITTLEYTKGGKKYVLTTDDSGVDFYSDPYTFFFVGEDGKKVAADGQGSAEAMSSAAGVALGNVEAFKPTADVLTRCGLNEDNRYEIRVVFEEDVKTEGTDATVTVTKTNEFTLYLGKGTNEDGEEEYYVMLKDSQILYEAFGGEDFFKAVEADLESKLICPVSADDTVSFKVEVGSEVYFYKLADIKDNEKLTGVFNAVTSLTREGIVEGEKGERITKITFDMDGVELVLDVYKYNDECCAVSFDKWDNLLVKAEKIDKIISDLKG